MLERLTMPNVLLNVPEGRGGGDNDDGDVPEAKFYSGDWSRLIALLGESRYDLILTSETIYSLGSQDSLLALLSKCLRPEGRVLLAAKTHYFGVGGGLRQFEERLEAHAGRWEFKTVWRTEQGVKREILEITKKKKNDA